MTEADWNACADPTAMLRILHQDHDNPTVAGFAVSARKLRLWACACCRQVWDKLTDDEPCPKCYNLLAVCVCGHTRGEHAYQDRGAIKCRAAGCACGPGCIHEGFVNADDCTDCGGTSRINRSRRAVEVAELFADGLATAGELESAREAADDALFGRDGGENSVAPYDAYAVAWEDAAVAAREIALVPRSCPPATQAVLLRCIFSPFRRYAWTASHDCKPSGHELQFLDERWRTRDALRVAAGIYERRAWGELGILADALEEGGCSDAAILDHCRGAECAACRGYGGRWYCRFCRGAWLGDLGDGCVGCENNQPLERRVCKPCGGTGCVPAVHGRGCWVLDLILNRE
jgi:hypothetical protein